MARSQRCALSRSWRACQASTAGISGVGARVALVGDAAHGLSPHIAAGGTLGIEDASVLREALRTAPDLRGALMRYETARMPRFDRVREFAASG